MNAVVLEIRGKKAAVLLENGSIVKTDDKGYEIGQRIIMLQPRSKTVKRAFRALSAAAAIILCTFGIYAYVTPYSYVSLDVNPSIEYILNRFDRVLSVTGVNDEGQDITQQIGAMNIRNRSISDAVSLTVDALWQKKYFSEGEQNVLLLAASADSEQKAGQLTDSLARSLSDHTQDRSSLLVVKSMRVTPQQVAQARQMGITPGKLGIVSELAEVDENPASFRAEEWIKRPVKDVISAIEANRRIAGGRDGSSANASAYPNNASEQSSSAWQNNAQNSKGKNDGLGNDSGAGSTGGGQGKNNSTKQSEDKMRESQADQDKVPPGQQNDRKSEGEEPQDQNQPASNSRERAEENQSQKSNNKAGGKNKPASDNSRKNKNAQDLEAYLEALEQLEEEAP